MGLQRIYAAAARGRRLGLVAEATRASPISALRRLRPGEGQAGRLHRRSDRAGPRRALPDRKPSKRRTVSSPGSSTSRRSPSTRWPRPAQLEPNRAGALYEAREALSIYGKAYLALALGLINDAASQTRIKTLLADITGKAITSATSTHWEEAWVDYWNMNTDTRTTSIVLDALAKLDPKNSLAPNAVRWLMGARKADRWETTQENAWAIMALTDWMAATGELEGDYDWQVLLNDGRWDRAR